jgi:hypothetical protein
LAAFARKKNVEVKCDHDNDYREHSHGRSPSASLPVPDECKEQQDTALHINVADLYQKVVMMLGSGEEHE